MRFKYGNKAVSMHWRMRRALKAASAIWAEHGAELVVTSPPDQEDYEHGPWSWHYYGMAVDLRSSCFSEPETERVAEELRAALPGEYQVVVEKNHIHVECALEQG